MTYKTCKLAIEKGLYKNKEYMQTKLDVFLIGNRIDQSEYEELTAMLEAR